MSNLTDTPTRDPRLDFFRGLGMFIIFVAHVPWNPWTLWIPARFGFSDATEIFVFCSGMASALAFGTIFDKRGWWLGTTRVAFRVWQVYWSHIALFFVILAMLVAIDDALGLGRQHIEKLNLHPFLQNTDANLVGLLTLTYVPNYFDILPMYLVILALLPVVLGLAKLSQILGALLICSLWGLATFGLLGLPAEPWSDRVWFFNPFAWQLVFFTGFWFMRGWLPSPPVNYLLVILAIAVILISLPFAYFPLYGEHQVLNQVRGAILPLIDKTNFGILRYVHFLALCYLAWIAAGPGGAYLPASGIGGAVVGIIRQVGQQSLAVFVASLVIAQAGGVVLDLAGRGALIVTVVNLAGFALLVAVARIAAFFKSQPWRQTAKVSTRSY